MRVLIRLLPFTLPFILLACPGTVTDPSPDAGIGPDAGVGGADAGTMDSGDGPDASWCACSPAPAAGACPCTPEAAARLGCSSNWIPICCGGGVACDSPPPIGGPITCAAAPGPDPGWCCSSPATCSP